MSAAAITYLSHSRRVRATRRYKRWRRMQVGIVVGSLASAAAIVVAALH